MNTFNIPWVHMLKTVLCVIVLIQKVSLSIFPISHPVLGLSFFYVLIFTARKVIHISDTYHLCCIFIGNCCTQYLAIWKANAS